MYKVIWIDDEFHLNEPFRDLAKDVYNIDLKPFKLRKDGMGEFERRPNDYDGVILDARMLDESSDELPDTDGLYKALFKLSELQGLSYFPVVIFSANRNDILNEQEFKKITKDIPIYKKSLDEQRLLEDLKRMIHENPVAQIKIEYKKAFELCTNNYIGEEYFDKLLKLLKVLRGIEKSSSTEDLISARKILEGIFQKLVSIGILPKELEGKLNPQCRVLECKDQSFIHIKEVVHPLIAFITSNILYITQDEGHLKDGLDLNVDKFRQNQGTNYLLYSITYSLVDIMIWFKQFFDENTSTETNKTYIKYNTGIVETDSSGNSFCKNESATYLLYQPKKNYEYAIGDQIRIKSWGDNPDISKRRVYNRIIYKFEKINHSLA